jgi:hypothetical protein
MLHRVLEEETASQTHLPVMAKLAKVAPCEEASSDVERDLVAGVGVRDRELKKDTHR